MPGSEILKLSSMGFSGYSYVAVSVLTLVSDKTTVRNDDLVLGTSICTFVALLKFAMLIEDQEFKMMKNSDCELESSVLNSEA